jgi:hypothetical protein
MLAPGPPMAEFALPNAVDLRPQNINLAATHLSTSPLERIGRQLRRRHIRGYLLLKQLTGRSRSSSSYDQPSEIELTTEVIGPCDPKGNHVGCRAGH